MKLTLVKLIFGTLAHSITKLLGTSVAHIIEILGERMVRTVIKNVLQNDKGHRLILWSRQTTILA